MRTLSSAVRDPWYESMVNLKEQVRYCAQRCAVPARVVACTFARSGPEPQRAWIDMTRMERRMRRRAASSDGSLTTQKGD